MASGRKSEPAAPLRKKMGTKTMQMASVDTSVGSAICPAPCMMAVSMSGSCSCMRWMFSIPTVASSTSTPTASASPPSVITLSVSPSAASTVTLTRMESGIDRATMRVLRQLPRKSRIMAAVRHAAMSASITTPSSAAFTKSDWSASTSTLSAEGSPARIPGRASRTRSTTSMVLAPPDLRTVTSAPRTPSRCTMLVCTAYPSRTCATSRTRTRAPLTTRMGRSFSASTALGLPLRRTAYSRSPIFAVPPGSTRFCALMASDTSVGDSPRACSCTGSRSTLMSRERPPYGCGTLAPRTVARRVRMPLVPRSLSCCSDSESPPSASCSTGTLAAL